MPETIIEQFTRKTVVHGKGPKDASIMIIGEAPGADEEKFGRPFVGSSGRLLEILLNKAGILRQQCYITNVVKERPHKNDISQFLDLSKKVPVESPEYHRYKLYLIDEINEVNPNVIIAVGSVALYTLTGKKSVTKWRGSILESETGHKVIPIIHPAAALRQYIYRHFISFDLKKVVREKDFPEIKLKDRYYLVDPDFMQVMGFLKVCKEKPMVAFDIEVSHEEVSCISFAYDEHQAISIPLTKGGDSEYYTLQEEREIWNMISEILEDEDIISLGQNVVFDATFLFRKYGIKAKNLHDTMIMMAILYPDFPKGLDFITSVFSDLNYYKDERKDMNTIISNNEAFWVYNARDSIVLMEAYPRIKQDLERMNLWETYENQRRLIQPLLYMTELGIKMDVDGMKNASVAADERLLEIEKEVNELTGRNMNLRSPTQLKEYFYGDKRQGNLGIKPYLDKGRPTTNEGALVRLARGTSTREPLKEAQLILEHRGLSKMNGTYLNMSLDDDNRVRTSMNPVGAKTGRLSSSKTIFGTGANLQNQPPMMKEFMLVDDNCVGYDIDLGQAENRIVAYIAPEPKMMEAFETHADIHSRTASYIFGIPEDEIRQMDKEGVKCETIGTGDYTHRFWGKKANHAFNYGQGYKKFAYQVEIPEDEGKMIHSRYHSAYPGVRKYHNWVQASLEKDRILENVLGRKYLFLDRWSFEMFESAYAFIPQSTVGDIINRRGLNYIYYNQDLFEPVMLLNQIHDSIVFQIPRRFSYEQHAKCIISICKSLETPLTFRGREFSIPADLTILPKNLKDGKEVSGASNMSVSDLTTIIKQTVEEDA
jgi:uracil-DNA glycosylase family 4